MNSSFVYRCSVLGILHWYNVVIPQGIIDLLKSTVEDFEKCLLKNVPFVEAEESNIEFHNLRLKDLRKLNETLDQFLTPIVHLIDFLVHFSMHGSHIFDQYLWESLQHMPAPKVPAVPARESVAATLFIGIEDVVSLDQDSTTGDSEDGTMQVSTWSVSVYIHRDGWWLFLWCTIIQQKSSNSVL